MNLRNMQGAALVEIALALPLLLLMVIGLCEFGWAMYVSNTLNNAAREGVRLAAVTPKPISTAAIKDQVVKSLAFGYDVSDLDVNVAPVAPPASGAVKVIVTLTYQSLTGMPPFSTVLNGKLKGEATMRYEL